MLALLSPVTTELPDDADVVTPAEQAEIREGTWYASERSGYLALNFYEYMDAAEWEEQWGWGEVDEVPADLQSFGLSATCNGLGGTLHVDEQARLQVFDGLSTAMGCPDTIQDADGQVLEAVVRAEPQLYLDDAGHLYLVSEEGTIEMQRERPLAPGSSLSSRF